MDAPTIDNIYYHDNDPTKPISAAGVLIYRNYQDKMFCLIQDHNNQYEDIGGNVGCGDGRLIETIGREVEDETNGIICSSDIIGRLATAKKIYIPAFKYCLHIIEATEKETMLTKADFKEKHIRRTIGWIAREDIARPATIRYRINLRLRSKALFDYLKEIERNMKYSTNLFRKYNTDDRTT